MGPIICLLSTNETEKDTEETAAKSALIGYRRSAHLKSAHGGGGLLRSQRRGIE